MKKQEKFAVVRDAAEVAVKIVANGGDAHLTKLSSSTADQLDLQPIIRKYGPTADTVKNFAEVLESILNVDSLCDGKISVNIKENDGVFFARIILS